MHHTLGQYRNNHIPLRELSGAVMQIEKYIYYLNRWGKPETMSSQRGTAANSRKVSGYGLLTRVASLSWDATIILFNSVAGF
jgi:hypothetical protein